MLSATQQPPHTARCESHCILEAARVEQVQELLRRGKDCKCNTSEHRAGASACAEAFLDTPTALAVPSAPLQAGRVLLPALTPLPRGIRTRHRGDMHCPAPGTVLGRSGRTPWLVDRYRRRVVQFLARELHAQVERRDLPVEHTHEPNPSVRTRRLRRRRPCRRAQARMRTLYSATAHMPSLESASVKKMSSPRGTRPRRRRG